MEDKTLVEHLNAFGLTGQEALVYLELFRSGTSNGYEIAKRIGISRSNVYKALEGLADKGGAYVTEANSRKYTAVDIEEFCQNKIQSLLGRKEILLAHMPKEKEAKDGYFTITSDDNISDKIKNMLSKAKKRVYLSMSSGLLGQFEKELEQLLERRIKVVVLTSSVQGGELGEKEISLKQKGAKIYLTADKKNQIGIITDSQYVLTGEFGKGKDSTCLYSGQVNFVQVFKDSMKNEIKLLELEKKSKGGKV